MTNEEIDERGFIRLPYLIRHSKLTGRYEWLLPDLEAESDEWFETIEEARKDVQACFE